jgi:hypothetical protein
MQKKVVKTELALIDDAKAIVNELTKQSESLGAESLAILSAKNKLADKITKLRQSVAPAKQIVKEYNQQLKDLGVNEPTSIVTSLLVAIEKAEKTALQFEKDFFK